MNAEIRIPMNLEYVEITKCVIKEESNMMFNHFDQTQFKPVKWQILPMFPKVFLPEE